MFKVKLLSCFRSETSIQADHKHPTASLMGFQALIGCLRPTTDFGTLRKAPNLMFQFVKRPCMMSIFWNTLPKLSFHLRFFFFTFKWPMFCTVSPLDMRMPLYTWYEGISKRRTNQGRYLALHYGWGSLFFGTFQCWSFSMSSAKILILKDDLVAADRSLLVPERLSPKSLKFFPGQALCFFWVINLANVE